jgi:hypothetical protein
MAGRPKTMARKLEQLQPYPWLLVDALSDLVPKQYLGQRPGEKYEEIFPRRFYQSAGKTSEQIEWLWRTCLISSFELAVRMEYLLDLLKEKAGITDLQSDEQPALDRQAPNEL